MLSTYTLRWINTNSKCVTSQEILGGNTLHHYTSVYMYIALHLQCRGKEVRTFVYGDYDFLCNMYSLSGASGMNLHTNKIEHAHICISIKGRRYQ